MDNITAYVAVLAVGVTAAMGWIGAFIIYPASQESRFRYRLWRVRDAIVDDVRTGALPRAPLVKELIANVEHAILHSKRFNLLRWRSAAPLVQMPSSIARREKIIAWMASLPPEQRAAFESHLTGFVSSLLRHLFTGSVLALAVLGVVNVVDITRSISSRIRKGVAGAIPPIRFTATPKLGARALRLSSESVMNLRTCLGGDAVQGSLATKAG